MLLLSVSNIHLHFEVLNVSLCCSYITIDIRDRNVSLISMISPYHAGVMDLKSYK